ncbi:MAG TPA: serine/threonine-protein kinase, partial [Myxococcota bacterium]|nr:serine/threonine-protein kinase [Myxococcota bacterium]
MPASITEGMVLLDRFTLRRRLGVGGMGEVFDAFDDLFQEHVALKVLKRDSPRDVEQFKREFRSISELRHPNLVPLYELFLEKGMCFFTMELLSGCRLTELPALSGAGGPGEALQRFGSILYQASLGLDTIHARGWMHLDLKPENMLWTADGRLVILDLGLARPTRWDPHAAPRAGTVPFMAPEQAGGAAFPASDWYGLGATLYTVFSHRFTFVGGQEDVLRRKQVERPPPVGSFCSVDPRLCALVDDLLALEPEERPTGPQIRARLRAMGLPAPEPDAEAKTPSLVLHPRQQAAAASFLSSPHTALLELRGSSGVGKTIFVDRLLEQHQERLVL